MSPIDELKPHLDILEKVEQYQHKAEFNRFLLVLTIAGFIAIIGGWISYIFNRFLNVDPTFFIFGVTGNPNLSPMKEPILFISVWLLYLIPILSAISFSTGTTGIVNWNKAYKQVGILAILLFLVAHIIIVFLGMKNSQYIPLVWGLLVCIGFILSSWFMYEETDNSKLRGGLVIFGIIALFLGVLVSFTMPNEVAQLVFGLVLGTILSFSGIISYFALDQLL
jgi:hypothetical protein